MNKQFQLSDGTLVFAPSGEGKSFAHTLQITAKTFQPAAVTADLRKQYESLALTNAEAARVVIANTTSRIVVKCDSTDHAPGVSAD